MPSFTKFRSSGFSQSIYLLLSLDENKEASLQDRPSRMAEGIEMHCGREKTDGMEAKA